MSITVKHSEIGTGKYSSKMRDIVVYRDEREIARFIWRDRHPQWGLRYMMVEPGGSGWEDVFPFTWRQFMTMTGQADEHTAALPHANEPMPKCWTVKHSMVRAVVAIAIEEGFI